MSMEKQIARALRDVGILPNLSGYAYLRTAIAICIENPSALNQITTFLYPAVAEKHGVTPTGAERAMRHAIELSSPYMDETAKKRYFQTGHLKMTNSLFIASLTEYLRNGNGSFLSGCSFCDSTDDVLDFDGQPICRRCARTAIERFGGQK